MGRFSWKNRAAAIGAGAVAAVLVGTGPAHAYKLDQGMLELKGLAFVNFTSLDTGNSAADDAGSGFHLDRAYFEMRLHPEQTTTYRITYDTKGVDQDALVKYAYVQIEYADGQSVKAGLNHTPVVDYYQTYVWGHRYVAKTFVDDAGLYTSSDLGVSFLGRVAEVVNYYVSIMNGEGYDKTSNGAGFAIAGRVEGTFGPAKVGIHGHTETDRNGTDGYDPMRAGIYVNVDGTWGNAAAEAVMADDGDAATTFKDGTGYSALVNVNIPAGNESQGFLRYDSMELTDSDPDPTTLIIVGAETEVHKNILVAVDFQQRDDGTDDVTQIGLHAQVKI